MERTYIRDLHEKVEQKVTVMGSVETRRDHGKLIFIDLRDRTGLVQAVALPSHVEAHATASDARAEWVLAMTGVVHKRPEKMVNAAEKQGNIEIEITDITVLGRAADLPFDKEGELGLETYLDYMPLTLRTKRKRAIFKIQSRIINAFRQFLLKEEFVEIQVPKLIGEDAEGGATVFEVPYFGHTAHLAQSPQFYKQIMTGVFERVFATTNAYRAEKHDTTRHLNEYTSLDFEFGFIEDHRDVMRLETEVLRAIMTDLKEHCAEECALLKAEIPEVLKEIPAMKLREAQVLIKKRTGEDCSGEPDLTPAHERFISDYAQKELNSAFIFITHYPVEKRPWYTYEDENDPGFTKSFDLLFRGIEITTGGQRIHEYEKLVESIKKRGLDPEKFAYYLQAFKYGMPPEGGLGMGLERLTARLLGLENIKEATLFPRDINRIDMLLSDTDEAEAK